MESVAKLGAQGPRADSVQVPRTAQAKPRCKPRRLRAKETPPLSRHLAGNRVSIFHSNLMPMPLHQRTSSIPLQPLELHVATQLRNPLKTKRNVDIESGTTVDILLEYFPKMLERQWPQETLSDGVLFRDAISPHFGLASLNCHGRDEYNRLMRFLRGYAFVLCKQTKVEVLRFWQPCRECVIVRWSMKFCPRVLHKIYGTTVQIDGVSELKLDRDGRICQHRVDITDRHKIKFDLKFQSFALRNPRTAIVPIG